jgi:hypothetical protein
MTPTNAKNVDHWCRTCGFKAVARPGASAHAVLRGHFAARHPKLSRPYRVCPAGCGFKASYLEKQDDRMYHGAYALSQKAAMVRPADHDFHDDVPSYSGPGHNEYPPEYDQEEEPAVDNGAQDTDGEVVGR